MSKPTECEIAVRLAGKKMIAQVAAHLDPATICVEFKMCKSALARLPSIEVTRELRCSYCNYRRTTLLMPRNLAIGLIGVK